MSIGHRSPSTDHRASIIEHGRGRWAGWVVALRALCLSGAFCLPAASIACAPADDTEIRPEVISVESPFRYPVELWDAEVEGETLVMVHVTEVGDVDSVYVLEPSEEAAFDSAAVAGAHELRFAPGRHGDERVAMWVRLPVRFRRSGP